MHEIEVPLAPDTPLDKAEAVIEAACAAAGLRLTLKDTLKAYPGCVHWHYKRGSESGTLEITLWAAKRCVWFKVSAGRQGAWIEDAMERLSTIIREYLT
jgi:hypothetical protein